VRCSAGQGPAQPSRRRHRRRAAVRRPDLRRSCRSTVVRERHGSRPARRGLQPRRHLLRGDELQPGSRPTSPVSGCCGCSRRRESSEVHATTRSASTKRRRRRCSARYVRRRKPSGRHSTPAPPTAAPRRSGTRSRLLRKSDRPEDYVVARGETHRVEEFHRDHVRRDRHHRRESHVRQDERFIRPR
jgi:hypothetical protein